MYQYAYVRLGSHTTWLSETFEDHFDVIEEYAQNGYRFVCAIPSQINNNGIVTRIDLVFETKVIEL